MVKSRGNLVAFFALLALALIGALVSRSPMTQPPAPAAAAPAPDQARMKSLYASDSGPDWLFTTEYANLICEPLPDGTQRLTATLGGEDFDVSEPQASMTGLPVKPGVALQTAADLLRTEAQQLC